MVKTRKKPREVRTDATLQMEILSQICQGNLKQKDIVDKLNRDKGSVSRRITVLENKGFIKNNSFKSKNNAKMWKITSSGIKELLQNSKPKEFWQFSLIIYDSDNENFKNAPNIDEMLNNNEQKNLQVSREEFLPHYYEVIRDQFERIVTGLPNIIDGSWFVLLDIIAINPPISFEEIEKILKRDYQKLYKTFKDTDKLDSTDGYPSRYQGGELERQINLMIFNKQIKKTMPDKNKFQLSHLGFLLYSYLLLNNLESNKYGIDNILLQHGLNKIIKLSGNEELLQSRISDLIRFNSKLFPGIFHEDRLKINEYYILMILVLIHFPIHREFFDHDKLDNYKILKAIQNKIEKEDNKKILNYYEEMRVAMFELYKEKETVKSFLSDLSDDFFQNIKEDRESRYAKSKEEWKKETERLRESPDEWDQKLAQSRDKLMPHRKFTEEEYASELLDKAKEMIEYNDDVYQNKDDPSWKANLPSPKNKQVINRVLDTILRKYLIEYEITSQSGRSYCAGKLDDRYLDYEKNVENKIIFNFYLLYRFLEPEKWEKNFGENEVIKKWHNKKIQRFWGESNKIAKIEENKLKNVGK
jgi:DNA-binding MarR family transcriptional regulator